jgi:hypothetical protein
MRCRHMPRLGRRARSDCAGLGPFLRCAIMLARAMAASQRDGGAPAGPGTVHAHPAASPALSVLGLMHCLLVASQTLGGAQSSTDVHVWRQELPLQRKGVQSVRVPFSSWSVWSSAHATDASTQVFSVLQWKPGAQSAGAAHSVLHAVVPSQAYAPQGMGVAKGLQLPLPSQ